MFPVVLLLFSLRHLRAHRVFSKTESPTTMLTTRRGHSCVPRLLVSYKVRLWPGRVGGMWSRGQYEGRVGSGRQE